MPTNPGRRDGEALRAATTRITRRRAADVLGCLPSNANRFFTFFGLLTEAERSLFRGRPSVLGTARPHGGMSRPLGETSEAAIHRYGALLDELLAWARVQNTIPPRGGSSSGGGETGCGGDPGGPGSGCGDAASSSRGVGGSEVVAVAVVVPISLLRSQPSPPRPRQLHRSQPLTRMTRYTGDRAQDEAETDRRMRLGLCLECIPNGAGAALNPTPSASTHHILGPNSRWFICYSD